MGANKYRYRPAKRAMPGQKLPDVMEAGFEERIFQLEREKEFTKHLRFYLKDDTSPLSGQRGLVLNKLSKDDLTPHGLDFQVEGEFRWGFGMDFDTGTDGTADFVFCYDYSADSNNGADIFRYSPASADTVANSRSTKVILSHKAGSPRSFNDFFTIEAGDRLAGVNISINNKNTGAAALTLNQRDTAGHWSTISFDNVMRVGCDMTNANTANFTLYDDVAGKTRWHVDSSGRMYLGNSTAPTAGLHLAAGSATAGFAPLKFTAGTNLTSAEAGAMEFDGTELYFSRSTTRRTVLLSKINDATDITFGTATGTKIGTSTSEKFAFWNAAPIAQPANNTELRAFLISWGALSGGTMPVNTNGGDITCNALNMSGALGGSGTAFSFKRFSLTFSSDADYTLGTGEKDALVIDVQAGTLTTTRNIIVPATGSAFYIVVNRNAQSVVLKTSGGTGITIPSARARMIYFPTGVNAFALTPSQDYTV